MTDFASIFKDAGFPDTIQYRGLTIGLKYVFDIPPEGKRFLIQRLSTKSHLIQGVRIIPPSKTKGFKVFVKQLDTWFEDEILRFWEDSAPAEIEVKILSPDRTVIISHCWLDESGKYVGYWGGGAMYWEEKGNSITFYCNDREPDDDFNDLIFRVTTLND